MSGITDFFTGGGEDTTVQAPAPIQAQGFSTPGLTATPSNGVTTLTRSDPLQGVIDQLGLGRNLATQGIGDLIGQIPDLTTQRLQDVENARRRSVGDLRSNLNRRGVLGSSFAGDSLARAESEFAGQAERTRGESRLQEIGIQSQLINQRLNTQLSTIQAELNQFNQEASIAGNVSQGAQQAAVANAQLASEAAQFNARAAQAEAQGAGSFLGGLLNTGVAAGAQGGIFGAPLPIPRIV